MTVNTTVTLLQARGVPRNLVVHQQAGGVLQVKAFRSSVGRNQNTYRRVRIVEGALYRLALVLMHSAIEHADAAGFSAILVIQAVDQIVERGFVLGENDQPLIIFPLFSVTQLLADQLTQAIKASVRFRLGLNHGLFV
ncbi:hypothetical protein D3C85_1533390 [compost metagenome]